MQIVVPMSGFGERFRRAGYDIPKPLIMVDGRPIVAHVIDLFPGEQNFIFICNEEHLNHPGYQMEAVLQHYCPTGRIVGIAPHKWGPVYAVQQVEHLIDPEHPVIVNYCDFTCYWDWAHFKKFVVQTACTGALPAYKGFHPHTLGTTNYAYMREYQGWVEDIQEKQPYTDNRMNEYASSGTYYFASGQLMKDAFRATVDQDLNVGGEYYVSLAYKYLLAQRLPVAVYPLQHFMQWGTPEDLTEYNCWSSVFRALADKKTRQNVSRGSLVVPMAGLGQRFTNEGYTVPKPLIPVSGKPMVVQAVDDLPLAQKQAFVIRSDMPGHQAIAEELQRLYPGSIIETVSHVTEGQACTALIGLDALERASGSVPEPITFAACDNGALYAATALQSLIEDPDVDVIVWGMRGYANARRHPKMFGWINADSAGKINHISVKEPLCSPATDPVILGTFTFRHAADFRRIVERMMARNGRVNGEYYIDSCINDAIELGLDCRLFEIDHFLCWGTPNDLRTFEYWQSCFHKWSGHPYELEKDPEVDPAALPELKERYRSTVPSIPSRQQT